MASLRRNIVNLLPIGLRSRLRSKRLYNTKVPNEGIFYQGNQPAGYHNLSEKIARADKGGPFEWPNMVTLNKSIQALVGDARRVVVIGSGTGTFEWYCTQSAGFEGVRFVASEFDSHCVQWCQENRAHDSIQYTSMRIPELLEEFGRFDLVVTVDVIEHVDDYGAFLGDLKSLASRAIITTPNRDRDFNSSISDKPGYYQHVREWNSGEFYWLLRTLYREVDLYAMPDVYKIGLEPIGMLSTMTPLVAHCRLQPGIE